MKLGLGLSIPGVVAQQKGSAAKAYARAVFQLDARSNPSTGVPTDLSANAMSIQNGSTAGSDANDATYLPAPSTLGVSRYVYLPGIAGNYLSAPDEAALDITGDIDLRAEVLYQSTGSGIPRLISKDGNLLHSYELYITATTGLPALQWAESDGTLRSAEASAPMPTNQKLTMRATLDVDNGAGGHAVNFYTSTDGQTWTLLGLPDRSAGAFTTSIRAETGRLVIGNRDVNTNRCFPGYIFSAQVYDGIDGNKVFDWSAEDTLAATKATFTASTGQTVTVNRSASPSLQTTVVTEDNYGWLLGIDDYIQLVDNAIWDLGTTGGGTLVVVYEDQAGSSTQQRLFESRDGSSLNGIIAFLNGGTTPAFIVADASAGGGTSLAPSAITVGALNVSSFVVTPTEYYARNNGAADATPATRPAGAVNTSTAPRIGVSSTSLSFDFSGLIRAVYWWNEELTDAELAAIESDWGAA